MKREADRALGTAAWLYLRRLAREGVSEREIASRLGIDRRSAARMMAAEEEPPPGAAGAGPPAAWEATGRRGSQLDAMMATIAGALSERPDMRAPALTELLRAKHEYGGSVDLVRRRLAQVRAATALPPGLRPGDAIEWDWIELPGLRRMGRARRSVWVLVASLPFSGAQTAHFTLDARLESFLEGHVAVFDWLGGAPEESAYEHLRPQVAKRDTREALRWKRRFRELRSHYAFRSAVYEPTATGLWTPQGEALGDTSGHTGDPGEGATAQGSSESAAMAPPRAGARDSLEEAVERLRRDFWRGLRFRSMSELDALYAAWRDGPAHTERNASTGALLVAERLAEERGALRALPRERFDFSAHRALRVSPEGYVRYGQSHYRVPREWIKRTVELHATRDRVWILAAGERVAEYARSYEPGTWLPHPPL